MKRFSKIKKADYENPSKSYFEFKATENPISDLHAVGLRVSHLIHDLWDKPYHEGEAHILTDNREGLEKAQAQLRKMGWEEMP